MEVIQNIIPLRDYCRQNPWPRLGQWNHWIYTRNPIALKCINKIGGRYMLDLHALKAFVDQATLSHPNHRY